MAIIKCKMCGGELMLVEGTSVAECEYCGTRQTVPSADNEKKLTLFGRAGRLLRACEFDKAAGVFESIVADFPEEAEAYWGLVLCKYGIEYVDDPATGKKIPTCHRSSFESVLDDENFDQACENADPVARRLYREEAKAIEELRKRIIEVSGKEAPYDIFICYKETDESGERTLDSVLAQDIYDALTEKGYRVFFSRVTLEDKLGQEYEPYIFAALNSAKVMLAVGTDYDHYNAVWVKNEWSRFLHLIASGQKKTLIPCYKNIDAYDMPKEFAKLQAQDLGKLGAMQDLLRGIDKLLGRGQQAAPAQMIVQQISSGPSADSFCERGEMFLEDREWAKANEYFEKALDISPKMSRAYLGKMLVARELESAEALVEQMLEISGDPLFQKALRYADDAYGAKLNGLTAAIRAKEEKLQRLKRLIARSATAQKFIAAGDCHTVGLKSNGAAVAVGGNRRGQCDILDETDLVAVAAGDWFTVGLKSDGTVVAAGRKAILTGWTDIVAIAAGWHTVGLKSDGTVVAVGNNDDHQCNVTDWSDIVAIGAGQRHTVGLKSNGTVVAVGANYDDRCNDWTDIVAIAAAGAHTIGLKSDGTVVAVGCNDDGQCNVTGWTDIVAISAGSFHTVGLKSDGTVVAVGSNDHGQCKVTGWTGIVAVAAGVGHTIGLKSDGTVVATSIVESWNYKDDGQCNVSGWKLFNSIDTLEEESREARKAHKAFAKQLQEQRRRNIPLLKPMIARSAAIQKRIAAGEVHTVGLKSNGTAVAVGANWDGQCNISGEMDLVAIAAGDRHTVGLKPDGTVVAVGLNEDGQCNITDWTDIVAIAAGSGYTIGLKSNGTVVTTSSVRDKKFMGFGQSKASGWTDIVAIAAGKEHIVGVKSDGTVVAIAAGKKQFVGMKPSGVIVAVGCNSYCECNVTSWTDIVAVGAGCVHTVGLKLDGTVVAVGDNDFGQCNVTGWTDIVAVGAGFIHTVGLKSDGTVVAVGGNDFGQCNVTDWTDIVAIAAGNYHTIGLKADGTVVATSIIKNMGFEDDGQSDVSDWKLFNSIDTLEEESREALKAAAERRERGRIASILIQIINRRQDAERRERERIAAEERRRQEEEARKLAEAKRRQEEEARKLAEEQRRKREHRDALNREATSLKTELSNLRGLFTGKRRKQIESRLAEIDRALNQLK